MDRIGASDTIDRTTVVEEIDCSCCSHRDTAKDRRTEGTEEIVSENTEEKQVVLWVVDTVVEVDDTENTVVVVDAVEDGVALVVAVEQEAVVVS